MNDKAIIKRNVTIALFAALMAAGAYLRIPVGPVPVTLTSFFMILGALILGARGGVIAVILYLITGTLGLPVFAGGSGPAVFAGPTGGFLAGYIPAAFLCGLISSDTENLKLTNFPFRDVAGAVLASLILYAAGVPWLKWRLGIDWSSALSAGMLPFLPGDALKLVSAVLVRQILIRRAAELLPSRSLHRVKGN